MLKFNFILTFSGHVKNSSFQKWLVVLSSSTCSKRLISETTGLDEDLCSGAGAAKGVAELLIQV